MKELSRLEVFLSQKLKRRIEVTGGMNPRPSRHITGEATRISVPKSKWEFGSCGRALLHSVSGESILITKKIGGR